MTPCTDWQGGARAPEIDVAESLVIGRRPFNMKRTHWIAPAALLAGLASTPSLAHSGVSVAVGLPPVAVDVGDVHVVIGAPPPPPVVVVAEPAPPPRVVYVVEPAPPPRVVYLREAPRSTVVVYPRRRVEQAVSEREDLVVEEGGCDHPGKHKGHSKHHGHGDHQRSDRYDGDHGVWR